MSTIQLVYDYTRVTFVFLYTCPLSWEPNYCVHSYANAIQPGDVNELECTPKVPVLYRFHKITSHCIHYNLIPSNHTMQKCRTFVSFPGDF